MVRHTLHCQQDVCSSVGEVGGSILHGVFWEVDDVKLVICQCNCSCVCACVNEMSNNHNTRTGGIIPCAGQ